MDHRTEEKKFANKRYSSKDLRSRLQPFFRKLYSAIAGHAKQEYFNKIKSMPPQTVVLEYGCGIPGDISLELADIYEEYFGIDISTVAIEKGKELFRQKKLNEKKQLICMDCQEMTFDSNKFDLVVSSGVIHHLDIDVALGEIARVLKPSGKAILIEPLGYNPFINLFRLLTPSCRTRNEHPLTDIHFKLMEKHFSSVSAKSYCLFTLFLLPLIAIPYFDRLLYKFSILDAAIINKIGFLGKHAWITIIELSDMKPTASVNTNLPETHPTAGHEKPPTRDPTALCSKPGHQ